METFLQKIAAQYGGIINTCKSSWYNGHAYMPLSIYTLSLNINDFKIQFRYEFRESEFKSSKSIDGGTFGDRHIFEFIASNEKKRWPGFEVQEIGYFKRILSKSAILFGIKCKSQKFGNSLRENHSLKEIMSFLNIDSEFSPNIFGKTGKDNYNLKIFFLTQEIHYNLLDYCFQFLATFDQIEHLPRKTSSNN